MKTTLAELKELFRLKSTSQLKAGLINKIVFLDSDNTEVQDEQLKKLLEAFRKEGAYDAAEVQKAYNIRLSQLNYLVKHDLIPSYKLVSSKGSKRLFLKSEIEKENLIKIIRTHRADAGRLGRIMSKVMFYFAETKILEVRDYEIFKMYYAQRLTMGQIAEKFNITAERVRQILCRTARKITDVMDEYQKQISALEKKHIEMCVKYAQLKASIEEEEAEKKALEQITDESLKRKLHEMNISVRLQNVFDQNKIKYAADLLQFTHKIDFFRFRNVGKKTLIEIERLYQSLGFPLV